MESEIAGLEIGIGEELLQVGRGRLGADVKHLQAIVSVVPHLLVLVFQSEGQAENHHLVADAHGPEDLCGHAANIDALVSQSIDQGGDRGRADLAQGRQGETPNGVALILEGLGEGANGVLANLAQSAGC